MRLKVILLVTALGATALPATAQSYSAPCRTNRGGDQAAGLVLGGILGGVLGSNVAGRGHRSDGTAVGAVLGGLVGSEIGRGSSRNCDTTYYGPNPNYSGPNYSQGYPSGSYNSGYATGPAPGYSPPPDYGYYPEGGYADDGYYDDRDRDHGSRKKGRHETYGYGRDSYKYNDDYAGRDCENATQITRLPDGTEIRRQVDACRDSYYGGWKVRD